MKKLIFITAMMMTTACMAQTPPAPQPPAVVAGNTPEAWNVRVNAELAICEAKLAEFERRLELLEGRL